MERHDSAYVRPSPQLLAVYERPPVPQEYVQSCADSILDVLRGAHIGAEIVSTAVGACLIRYELKIDESVRLYKALSLWPEIGLRLHTCDGVSLRAGCGRQTVIAEVRSPVRATVGLREVLSSPQYTNAGDGALAFALGQDADGSNVIGSLRELCHILVGGVSGSGKSIFLSSMLVSLIGRYSPAQLKFLLIDLKQSEFPVYEGLPHLLQPVVTDAQAALTALDALEAEMEHRYALLRERAKTHAAVFDIDGYNASLAEGEAPLPKIVVVADELADLMLLTGREAEERIRRLAQRGRAAGIHLVLATLRVSPNVLTGAVRANFPTRIAFRVSLDADSRALLDETGAQHLFNCGDMLLRSDRTNVFYRLQGAYVSAQEVHAVVQDVIARNGVKGEDDA